MHSDINSRSTILRRQIRSELPRPRDDSGDDELAAGERTEGVQRTGLPDSFTIKTDLDFGSRVTRTASARILAPRKML
jgi:hypothetical protein